MIDMVSPLRLIFLLVCNNYDTSKCMSINSLSPAHIFFEFVKCQT